MKSNDYWSIDELLAGEEEVTIVTTETIRGLGYFDRENREPDLKRNRRVTLPLWLGLELTQRSLSELDPPNYMKEHYIAAVQADPTVVNLRERSPYFFEVGVLLSEYLDSTRGLVHVLLQAYLLRFKFILEYIETKSNPNILRKLTETEKNFYEVCRHTAQEYRDWRERKNERLGVSLLAARASKRLKLVNP